MLEGQGQRVISYRRSNLELNAYHGLTQIGVAKKALWATDTYREVSGLLQREKPDVVHVHNTFVVISPSIYSACYEARVPVVQTLHNYRLLCPAATFFRDGRICEECLDSSLLRSVQHRCYHGSRSRTAVLALMLAAHRFRGTWNREITSFIALTEFARGKYIEGGLPAEKIFVKPNFVDPDPQVRTGDGDYAVFVGRLSPEKRVSTLLDAWTLLRRHIPLVVVGGGPELHELESEYRARGLADIHFRGQLPRDHTIAAIKGARLLIFSSEWYETFGLTMVEAFACGTPVIASCVGAMTEIVANGRTGLHFNTGDPQDLATKVEWAWNHPEELRAIGKEARREYESKYTAKRNYPILMEIYERAIQASRN